MKQDTEDTRSQKRSKAGERTSEKVDSEVQSLNHSSE